MSILAAALLAGCNDNDDDAIADGTLSCSVNASGQEFVIVRENGSWKQKEECKGSCNDGACLSTHLTCTSSESKCVKDALDLGDDSSIVETCSNGEIRHTNCALLGKVCGRNDVTNSVGCVDNASAADRDCVDGSYRCNLDGKRQFCTGGKWKDNNCAADKVCSAGECVNQPKVCNEGEKVCDGIVARTCKNNAWIDQTCDEATQACVNGACITLPKKGDSCGDFIASCSNGSLYSCGIASTSSSTGLGYAVYVDACDDSAKGKVCLNLSTGADCVWKNDSAAMKEVGPCKNAGDIFFAGCDGNYMDAVKCIEKDGVLYGQLTDPDSICEGNTRISCSQGQVIEESCIACNYSNAYEQAQCVTENGGNNSGNNGGSSSGGNGGSSSSGATCDVFECSQYKDQTTGKTLEEMCALDGHNTALCGYNSDGKLGYMCATNASEACDSGSAYKTDNQDGSSSIVCLVVGEDASCLGGGSSSDSSYEICDEDCSSMPGSTAVCTSAGYQCSKPCSQEGDTATLCDIGYVGNSWTSYPVVCTSVGNGLYYVSSAQSQSDFTVCTNSCNADNTVCAE